MLLLLPLLLIIFVIVLARKSKLGFLKNRYFILIEVLSLAWWVFLIVGQLRTHLSCTPYDELCNSGNTFWGDVTWGSMLAIFTLSIIWVPLLFWATRKTNKS